MTIASLAAQVLNAMFAVRLTIIVLPTFLIAVLCVAGAFRASQAHSGQAPTAQVKPVDQKTESGRGAEPYRLKLAAPSDVKASAGHGKFLAFALDESGRRIQANGEYAEKLEEHRWAVVIGALDHDAIRKSLGLAAAFAANKSAAPAKVQPDYRRLDVQRQERRDGADWSAWADVDHVKNDRILGNLPEVESEDLIPEQLRRAALADPLPFLKDGRWAGADVERLRSSKQEADPPPPVAKGFGGRRPIPPIECARDHGAVRRFHRGAWGKLPLPPASRDRQLGSSRPAARGARAVERTDRTGYALRLIAPPPHTTPPLSASLAQDREKCSHSPCRRRKLSRAPQAELHLPSFRGFLSERVDCARFRLASEIPARCPNLARRTHAMILLERSLVRRPRIDCFLDGQFSGSSHITDFGPGPLLGIGRMIHSRDVKPSP